MTIDVSVIIAAYNIAPYLERAVDSALAQEGVSLEVVIVDDRSSDATWALAQKLAAGDARVRAVQMDQNGGPGAARNRAMAEAKGTWIAVLDGDDAFAPGRLAACLKMARAAKADIVVDNLTVCPEEGGAAQPMFPLAQFSKMKNLDLAGFIAGNRAFLGGHTLGYLKPVFAAAFLKAHDLSYPEDIRIGEDYLLMAAALASGAVCAVEPSAGYLYTVRSGSISHRLSLGDVERIEAGDARFLQRYPLSGAALTAQKSRAFRLSEAYGFTQLIDALKQKNMGAALRAVISYPTAVRHLWRPVGARIEQLLRQG